MFRNNTVLLSGVLKFLSRVLSLQTYASDTEMISACLLTYLFIPRLYDRANVEQTSSKHQAGLMEPPPHLAQM